MTFPNDFVLTQKQWTQLVRKILLYLQEHEGTLESDLFKEERQELPTSFFNSTVGHYCYAFKGEFLPSGKSDGIVWKPSQAARPTGDGLLKRYFYYNKDGKKIQRQVIWLSDSKQWCFIDYRVNCKGKVRLEDIQCPEGFDLPKLIKSAHPQLTTHDEFANTLNVFTSDHRRSQNSSNLHSLQGLQMGMPSQPILTPITNVALPHKIDLSGHIRSSISSPPSMMTLQHPQSTTTTTTTEIDISEMARVFQDKIRQDNYQSEKAIQEQEDKLFQEKLKKVLEDSDDAQLPPLQPTQLPPLTLNTNAVDMENKPIPLQAVPIMSEKPFQISKKRELDQNPKELLFEQQLFPLSQGLPQAEEYDLDLLNASTALLGDTPLSNEEFNFLFKKRKVSDHADQVS